MLAINPNISVPEAEPESIITIYLISLNKSLAEACRAILEELCPLQYIVHVAGYADELAGADIYIWDSESIPNLPPAMVPAGKSTRLVIGSKAVLASLRPILPDQDFLFLQSPLTPFSLRVVLESSIARCQSRRDGTEDPLRLRIDRDRILQKLLETNLRLQDLDRDRTNFLTRVIHDIRVPLMAVQGYCGLLLAGQLGPIVPEEARTLEKMQRSLERLGGLAAALMDFCSGGAQAKPKLLNASVEACIDQAIHETLPVAEQKEISLNMLVEPPTGTLLFDPGNIEQVLVNLLDNACKFTPKHGSIDLRGYSHPSGGLPAGYRIDISDTGPGIASEHIGQIFNEYTSYGGVRDRSGSGLGLAICRMIVEAHDGRIWATSDRHGATFSLSLPFVQPQGDLKHNSQTLHLAS